MWKLQMLHKENQIVNPVVYEFQWLRFVKICFAVRFLVLMLVNIMTAVLKDVKPCIIVDKSQRFRGTCCLHLQGTSEMPYFLLMLILVRGCLHLMAIGCVSDILEEHCASLLGSKPVVRKSVQVIQAGRRLTTHKITFFSINLGDWYGCFLLYSLFIAPFDPDWTTSSLCPLPWVWVINYQCNLKFFFPTHFDPEDGDSKFLQNVINTGLFHMLQRPQNRININSTSLLKLKVSYYLLLFCVCCREIMASTWTLQRRRSRNWVCSKIWSHSMNHST